MTIYKSELSTPSKDSVYVVPPKGGFNVDILLGNPASLFHSLLLQYVPDAKYDMEQFAKCLAFEVPIAAAFHLYRLNESVVHVYWDTLTKQPRLTNASVGDYLTSMQSSTNAEKFDANILNVLDQINKLHRNPVLHPEINLTAEDALELFGIINSAISCMVREIDSLERRKMAS